jgi:hypothetical protein
MNRFGSQAEAAQFMQEVLRQGSAIPVDTDLPAVLIDAMGRPRVMKSSGQSPDYWPIIKGCRHLLEVNLINTEVAQK